MEDRQIIRLLKKDPAEGLREAIAKYRGLVGLVVSRVLGGCPQDAEECIADTFVQAWKNVARLDEERGSLKGFLLCTARNRAIDRYRSLQKQNVLPLDEVEIAGDDDPIDRITGGEDGWILQQLISSMTEPDREIFLRRYFLFERVREIAARFGVEEGQIKSRLFRGRQRLKKELAERGVTA